MQVLAPAGELTPELLLLLMPKGRADYPTQKAKRDLYSSVHWVQRLISRQDACIRQQDYEEIQSLCSTVFACKYRYVVYVTVTLVVHDSLALSIYDSDIEHYGKSL